MGALIYIRMIFLRFKIKNLISICENYFKIREYHDNKFFLKKKTVTMTLQSFSSPIKLFSLIQRCFENP